MVTVQRWTGREARLLRDAKRLSLRDFAAHLGVNDRTISKWEAGGRISTDSQALLDTALAQGPDGVKARFAESLGLAKGCGTSDAELLVDSHKFIPVFIGADRAKALREHMTTVSEDGWLKSSSARIDHPGAEACRMHVFACGVAVFHFVHHRRPSSLTDLALWRYRSYATDLPWARNKISEALDEPPSAVLTPEYVLSLYWLASSPWNGDDRDTALRLLSTPSVLVDRSSPDGPIPLDSTVETSLLATGFDHPDIVSFGVRGISAGYAGWSGVAYTALAPERSLSIDELVTCELQVQALWCYSRQIQQLIEDGRDPLMPETYGWRFLRAAYSRLTTARARETAQHCLMREAIMKTSGLTDRLRAAQDALRDSVG